MHWLRKFLFQTDWRVRDFRPFHYRSIDANRCNERINVCFKEIEQSFRVRCSVAANVGDRVCFLFIRVFFCFSSFLNDVFAIFILSLRLWLLWLCSWFCVNMMVFFWFVNNELMNVSLIKTINKNCWKCARTRNFSFEKLTKISRTWTLPLIVIFGVQISIFGTKASIGP